MYKPIPASEVPQGLIFHVPRQNQGQIVEVAYASSSPGDYTEACHGDAYKRVTDHSDRSVEYYRRTSR